MNITHLSLAVLAGIVAALLVHFLGDASWGSSIISGVVIAAASAVVMMRRGRRRTP